MSEKKAKPQEVGQPELLEITPVESPSENVLVTEQLQRMPKIFSRGLIYIIVLTLLSALIYSLLGKMDIVAECRAVARPHTHKIKILSDRVGYIEKIFISEGQSVEENAPLFLIRSKESLRYAARVKELRHSIPLKKEYYNTKLSSARDELHQLESDYKNDMRIKKLKLDQNSLSLNSIDSDLSYWEKEIEFRTQEYESDKTLHEEGILSQRELNATKSKLEKARSEFKKLSSEREIILKENKIVEEEIKKIEENFRNRKIILGGEFKNQELDMETTLNSMQNELEMNEEMLSLQDSSSAGEGDEKEKMVRAENAGTISELYFRNTGEYVRESDLLCTILPAGSPFYMDIIVANKDVGFIEEDMKIKYKFDAFPYTDYGILLGQVSTISPSAIEDKSRGFFYQVRGNLDKAYFEIKGRTYPIKAGMTATAELVIEHKSIFSFLFRKFKEKF